MFHCRTQTMVIVPFPCSVSSCFSSASGLHPDIEITFHGMSKVILFFSLKYENNNNRLNIKFSIEYFNKG